MAEIAESWKKYLMPQYIDWNFGTGKYPVFRFGVISDATKDVIKELFTVVATAQSSKWTDEFIRELEKKLTDRLGLDVDYDEVKEREEAAKEEQARLTEAYYAQRGGGARRRWGSR